MTPAAKDERQDATKNLAIRQILARVDLIALIRHNFNEEAQQMLMYKRWKDGIDVDHTRYAVESFAEDVVRAALSAIEVTDAMISAGLSARDKYGRRGGVGDQFQAMIKAMLAEG